MRDLLDIRPAVLFVLLCLLTWLLLYIKQNFIILEMVAFEILEERGQLGVFRIFAALQFFSVPAVYLYKFSLTALVIWLGCFAWGYRVHYFACWQIALAAEMIFILPELLKIGWFLLVQTDPEFWDVRSFYPLSLMHFFDYREIADRWHYPLKALNLFEVIYWFLLVAGVHLKAGKSYERAQAIVFTSYVPVFLGWLVYYLIIYK